MGIFISGKDFVFFFGDHEASIGIISSIFIMVYIIGFVIARVISRRMIEENKKNRKAEHNIVDIYGSAVTCFIFSPIFIVGGILFILLVLLGFIITGKWLFNDK